MTYGLKIFNSSGVETLNLSNNTGLIVAQYNYGPLTATGGYLYTVTNANFANCYAIALPAMARMFTDVYAEITGTTLNVFIQTTADGSANPRDTYIAVYIINKGSL
jgi:hypothetical protein